MEYMMVNGYQIPALTLNEPPMPEIGKYGSLRRKFLRENAPMVFDEMLLEGTLYPHLAEMDNAVHRQKSGCHANHGSAQHQPAAQRRGVIGCRTTFLPLCGIKSRS